MRILSSPALVELVFQRSKFVGILEVVINPEQARTRLREAKAKFADATHVVHAFRTGNDKAETYGCSDDGEPPGTAGRPVLEVLKGAGGGNSLLLVVRWFGGVKLGTGGLVKAYTRTAQAVVDLAAWEECRVWISARITVDWGIHRLLLHELTNLGARVDRETFASQVTMEVRVPEDCFDSLQIRTRNLTRGHTGWVIKEDEI
jgi:uncharacterized YigZ family protein